MASAHVPFVAICDPVGFSQHGADCWSDSVQQILMSADGVKEITQELAFSMTTADLVERQCASNPFLIIDLAIGGIISPNDMFPSSGDIPYGTLYDRTSELAKNNPYAPLETLSLPPRPFLLEAVGRHAAELLRGETVKCKEEMTSWFTTYRTLADATFRASAEARAHGIWYEENIETDTFFPECSDEIVLDNLLMIDRLAISIPYTKRLLESIVSNFLERVKSHVDIYHGIAHTRSANVGTGSGTGTGAGSGSGSSNGSLPSTVLKRTISEESAFVCSTSTKELLQRSTDYDSRMYDPGGLWTHDEGHIIRADEYDLAVILLSVLTQNITVKRFFSDIRYPVERKSDQFWTDIMSTKSLDYGRRFNLIPLKPTFALILSFDSIDVANSDIGQLGHVTAFFACNGVEYIYDNERGVKKFPWYTIWRNCSKDGTSPDATGYLNYTTFLQGLNLYLPKDKEYQGNYYWINDQFEDPADYRIMSWHDDNEYTDYTRYKEGGGSVIVDSIPYESESFWPLSHVQIVRFPTTVVPSLAVGNVGTVGTVGGRKKSKGKFHTKKTQMNRKQNTLRRQRMQIKTRATTRRRFKLRHRQSLKR